MDTFLILLLILIAVSIILTIFFYRDKEEYEKEQFILFLLDLLENTDSWEKWECPGLCNLISKMYWYDYIDTKTYNKYKKMLKSLNPDYYINFWFEKYEKQPRIDYLKKLLNE